MLVRGDAARIPLRSDSVDLIVTSPPYFALRSYQDGGEHYAGQIGSEPTPQDFLQALWAVTAEMARVLKPTGSIFVNLGDKYSGSGGHNNGAYGVSGLHADREHAPAAAAGLRATRRNAPDRYNQDAGGIPAKSLMGLPWRYANGCVDHLGLILRRDIIWHKPNGLPESVSDRCRSSHEYWFHLVKQGSYYSAIDEIRQPQVNYREGFPASLGHRVNGEDQIKRTIDSNPLGVLPGSVWTIASEPLIVPQSVRDAYELPDHFAAFPQEWPRRLILGWSPSGICTACGDGRRPVLEHDSETLSVKTPRRPPSIDLDNPEGHTGGWNGTYPITRQRATIVGYSCRCDLPLAKTRPAVVLDPFGGTGTVAMVARALGRRAVNLDMSRDYNRLARWRVYQSGHAAKTEDRTNAERQGTLL